jgi:hypothetical protein
MTSLVHSISLVLGVALFQKQALAQLVNAPILAVMCIPLLAGLSEMAGQSFILVWRRVRWPQSIASYALTAVVHVGAVSIWAGAALLILRLDHIHFISVRLAFSIASASYAPRLLGVLTIAPYYGELLGRALDAWAMACVGWGLVIIASASLPAATLCACAGWLVSHVFRHFGGYLSAPILNRLGLVIAGAPSA